MSVGYGKVAMQAETPNIAVVHSVWRRLKKGRIVKVCRDLEPIKDVKGGGGPVTDKCKATTDNADRTDGK